MLVVPLVVDVSSSVDSAIEYAFFAIWAVFAIELGVRTYFAERRLRYLARHWLDVLVVALPILRPLRIARSARSLRVLRLSRVAPFFAKAWKSIVTILRRRGLQYVLLTFIVIIVASAGVVLLLERERGVIDDYGTALWWAIGAATAAGSGDAVPETREGRGVAVFLGFVGLAFGAWFTANIAAFLVEHGSDEGEGVTLSEVMQKLEDVEAEVRQLRASSDNLQ